MPFACSDAPSRSRDRHPRSLSARQRRRRPTERGDDQREGEASDQRSVIVTVRLPHSPSASVSGTTGRCESLDRRARVGGDAGAVAGDLHARAERDDRRVDGDHARPGRQSARGSTVERVGGGHDGEQLPGARRRLDRRGCCGRGRRRGLRRRRSVRRAGRAEGREARPRLGFDRRDGRCRLGGPGLRVELDDPPSGEALARSQLGDVGGTLRLATARTRRRARWRRRAAGRDAPPSGSAIRARGRPGLARSSSVRSRDWSRSPFCSGCRGR